MDDVPEALVMERASFGPQRVVRGREGPELSPGGDNGRTPERRKPKDWRNQLEEWLRDWCKIPGKKGPRPLPGNLRALYSAIADYWNPEYGYAFPGVERLAGETGWTERSIRRMFGRLEAATYREIDGSQQPILRIEEGGGYKITNRYHLAFFSLFDTLTERPGLAVLRNGVVVNETRTAVHGNPDPQSQNPDRKAGNPDPLSRNPDGVSADPVSIRDPEPVGDPVGRSSSHSQAQSAFNNASSPERKPDRTAWKGAAPTPEWIKDVSRNLGLPPDGFVPMSADKLEARRKELIAQLPECERRAAAAARKGGR